MASRFWCVTALFNPAGYRSRMENYHIFAERLARQQVPLLTVEMASADQPFSLPAKERTYQLRGQSVLWQKERLINHAISQLPAECDRVAWLDADALLPDGWVELLMERLEQYDFVQLFQTVIHMKPGQTAYGGERLHELVGIARQYQEQGPAWLPLRLLGHLPYAEPGFDWAARRQALAATKGLYDRAIVGAGDCILADCLLDSIGLHPYILGLTAAMVREIGAWQQAFRAGDRMSVGYLPVDLYHLWHGNLQGRDYNARERIYRRHDFDPQQDLRLEGGVWEWASDKPELHQDVLNYFKGRKEDGDRRPVRVLDVANRRLLTVAAETLHPTMARAKIDGVEGEVWVDPRALAAARKFPVPLSENAQGRLSQIQEALKDVLPRPVADWETDFRRQANAEQRIAAWLLIAEVFTQVTAGKGYPVELQQAIFHFLLACALLGKVPALDLARPKSLAPSVVEGIEAQFFAAAPVGQRPA
jgi:hypothetical protein